MPVLNDAVKSYIVRSLACYNTPQEVANLVKDEFGLEVDRGQIAKYDPSKPSGDSLGKKFKDIFEQTRKKFLEDVSQIPLANPAVRIAELAKMTVEARGRKNNVLAAQHMEQIAKEVGGAYTNKIKVAGGDKGDNPLNVLLSQIGSSAFQPVADDD